MDHFKQLETFVSVASRGSLSAAAAAEGVAPAIIGRRIDALEERLGVKLLIRTTRKISLTFEGSAFLEDCQRILNDLHNAEASVSAGGVKASGHLRVTAPAGYGRKHVAPLVPLFIESHPDVTITLDLSDRVVDLVNEGSTAPSAWATCPTPAWFPSGWQKRGVWWLHHPTIWRARVPRLFRRNYRAITAWHSGPAPMCSAVGCSSRKAAQSRSR